MIVEVAGVVVRTTTIQVGRELLRVTPERSSAAGAAQVGVSVGVPLAVIAGLGRLDLLGYAAFGALAAVYGKRATRWVRLRAQSCVGAGLVAAVGIGGAAAASGAPAVVVAGLSVSSLLGLLLSWFGGWLPVPSLFLVFATGAIASAPLSWHDLPQALLIAAASVAFALAVSQIVVSLERGIPRHTAAVVRGRVPALGYAGLPTLIALYAGAPVVAVLVATGTGLGHPFWAAVAAVVPLAGAKPSDRLGRGVHRLLGTVLGIGIAYAILSTGLPVWALIVAIAVFQVLTELYVTTNYTLAVVFITPMALILSTLSTPTVTDQLFLDRVVGSLIGVAVTVFALVLIRSARRIRASGAPGRRA